MSHNAGTSGSAGGFHGLVRIACPSARCDPWLMRRRYIWPIRWSAPGKHRRGCFSMPCNPHIGRCRCRRLPIGGCPIHGGSAGTSSWTGLASCSTYAGGWLQPPGAVPTSCSLAEGAPGGRPRQASRRWLRLARRMQYRRLATSGRSSWRWRAMAVGATELQPWPAHQPSRCPICITCPMRFRWHGLAGGP